jgi:lipopolysaccharide transport system ATP-binding protein
MSDVAIRVEGLGKLYNIGATRSNYMTLRDVLVQAAVSPFRKTYDLLRGRAYGAASLSKSFWALQDIDFEIKCGEVVGIVGLNGAGKSTLLKILSKITEPTKGRAEVFGRVGSLLEVGTGFHPELTGRENIYLNGAILGMKRTEVARKFDTIVDFSELEEFIDTPVKHYSSGMYTRLAFAVAAHLDTEVLLVDEVLAVGDVAFQKKCLGKMGGVAQEGRTVLFVSHNMSVLQTLCERGLLLRQGKLVLNSSIDATVRDYLTYLNEGAKEAFVNNPERSGNGKVRFTSVSILDETGMPTDQLIAGKETTLVFTYANPADLRTAQVAITIYNQLGVAVTHLSMHLTNQLWDDLGAEGELRCHIERLPFPIGQYRVAATIVVDREHADVIPNILVFDVVSSTFYESGHTPALGYCATMIEHSWTHRAGAGV